jgi:excinuclease UvrABC nuclease subunit
MHEAAEQKHYEAAAKARDALAALERAASVQSVVLDDHSNLDVLAVASDGGRAAVVRFRVRFGRIIGRSVHLIDRSMDEATPRSSRACCPSSTPTPTTVPPVVVVAERGVGDALMRRVPDRPCAAKPVEVAAPQRGKRRRGVELAKNDAQSVINRDSLRRQSDHNVRSRALQELGQALALAQPPYRIECFDMSHLQGTNYVGSMVVFEDGLAKKSDYRHFNVKEVLGNDDVGAMEEVVRRRLSHWTTSSRRVEVPPRRPHHHRRRAAAAARRPEGRRDARSGRRGRVHGAGQARGAALPTGLERARSRWSAARRASTWSSACATRPTASPSPSTAPSAASRWSPRRCRASRDSVRRVANACSAAFGSLDALRQATLDELEALAWLPGDVARRLYDHLQAPAQPKPTKGSDDE